VTQGNFAPINSIKIELKAYFEGSLHEFQTPVRLFGTSFQKRVWGEVRNVPRERLRVIRSWLILLITPKRLEL
jgi:O6-methylguanine-DNA--protein-cysteine methyltransferase